MEKRYQVFVSSTYGDLREERQEVMQALLELDCIPSGMELFPAADDDQWTLIKRVIDDCDYYVVIVAGRYGSIGAEGKSYTQMEYEYAVEKGKPVIAFLHLDPGKIQADKTDPEHHEKLETFRKVAQRKMCKFWSTPQELGSVVSRSIVKIIKDKPGIGWVRADRVLDESAVKEILTLRNRIADLEQKLSDAVLKPPVGTEDLAKGSESIKLVFRFRTQRGVREDGYRFTWNRLLAILGPLLLKSASDTGLKNKLLEVNQHDVNDGGGDASMIEIRDEDFQQVKIQFLSLGLIRRETEVGVGRGDHWVLTPFGETRMMQIAAIRSTSTPQGT